MKFRLLLAATLLALVSCSSDSPSSTQELTVAQNEPSILQTAEVVNMAAVEAAIAEEQAKQAYLQAHYEQRVRQWQARQQKVSAASASKPVVGPAVQESSPPPSGDFYHRLAMCETGGKMNNPNTGNGYYGYFQFAATTWWAVTGQPRGTNDYAHYHPYEYQRQMAAKNITPGNFSGQHPHCSKVMRREGWSVPID